MLAAGLALGGLTACANPTAEPVAPTPTGVASPTPSLDLSDCALPFLTTVTAGRLTVGIPVDVDAPYIAVERNSKARIGLEAEVVYAVADALGFRRTAVFWEEVEVDPAAVVVPESVDLVVGQVPIAPSGVANAVFTAPYLDAHQVVVARAGTPAAAATDLAAVAALRLAVVPASRAALAVQGSIRPTTAITEITGPQAGVGALRDGDADALVLDLADAGRVVAASDGELVIVGQLPPDVGDTSFGLALAPGNPLASCVDRAVAEVIAAGTVDDSIVRWLGEGARRALGT